MVNRISHTTRKLQIDRGEKRVYNSYSSVIKLAILTLAANAAVALSCTLAPICTFR